MKCPTHPHVEMVSFCPACRGSVITKKKSLASAINGRKGGRPPGPSKKTKKKWRDRGAKVVEELHPLRITRTIKYKKGK